MRARLRIGVCTAAVRPGNYRRCGRASDVARESRGLVGEAKSAPRGSGVLVGWFHGVCKRARLPNLAVNALGEF